MASRELYSQVKVQRALAHTAISSNTTTAGAVIDLQGYESALFVIQSATITDGTYTPLIEECDTSGGTYTAVDDADLTNTEASVAFVAADDNVAKKIGYIGTKRYVKLSLVSTGVTSGGGLSATAVLGHPNLAPVA